MMDNDLKSGCPGEVIRIIDGRGRAGPPGVETLYPCADMGSLLDRNGRGRTLEFEKVERRGRDDLVDLIGIEQAFGTDKRGH